MHKLEPVIQNYDWGSRVALAKITGREYPTAFPEAEMWMGAHEDSPSGAIVEDPSGAQKTVPLDELIAANPRMHLGKRVYSRFGARLPFLLKVLAAEKPLSIQAHPSAADVAACPEQYADKSPKPESWVALSPCQLFAGSRPFADIKAITKHLNIPALNDIVAAAAQAGEPADCTRAFLAAVLQLPASRSQALAAAVTVAAKQKSADAQVLAAIAKVADFFPEDIGLVVLLSMRYRTLSPGDGLFIGPGILHCLIRGSLVEIQANSNNVVRGGLTKKEINIAELLRIVDVEEQPTPDEPTTYSGVKCYPTHSEHFSLCMVNSGSGEKELPSRGGPRIMMALGGNVQLTCAENSIDLAPGESVFLSANEGKNVTGFRDSTLATGPVKVCGDAHVVVAGIPLSGSPTQTIPLAH